MCGVILDVDGTLADSNDAHAHSTGMPTGQVSLSSGCAAADGAAI
jgi:phosphoglycolate phosphatase-like HAD superfamily hydrolase